MPTISKIRLTNIAYEGGNKQINDKVLYFDGNNSAILLENGGGKTVFIHTVLQAILPHTDLGNRKIRETLELQNAPAHIGIEWIVGENPRRYVTTVVNLFMDKNKLGSLRYVFTYEEGNPDALEHMPFVQEQNGAKYPSYREDMMEYYGRMKQKSHNAETFDTIGGFQSYLENHFQIITDEWKSVVKINSDEGGIEKFFEKCKTTNDLYDKLLIPTVEDSISGYEEGAFATLFEKQREGFKEYHKLKKSIAENEKIVEQLDLYMLDFKEYDQVTSVYETVKQHAKGLHEAIVQAKNAGDAEAAGYELELEKWAGEKKLYELRCASEEILQMEAGIRDLQADHKEKELVYRQRKGKYGADKIELVSLRFANNREKALKEEQLLALHEQELAEKNQDGELFDYEADLEETAGKLHGYFLAELEKLERLLTEMRRDKALLIGELEDDSVAQKKGAKQLSDLESDLAKLVGSLQTLQGQNQGLLKELLANPAQEDLEQVYRGWESRHQYLEEELVRLPGRRKKLSVQKERVGSQVDMQVSVRNSLQERIVKGEQLVETISEEQTRVQSRLGLLEPRWAMQDDIYLKEASIRATLEEKLVTKELAREESLRVERLALRYVDDYDGQSVFFSDPFLEERLRDWQSGQLIFTTGPEYFAGIPADRQAEYLDYPLWAVTLVAREVDKEKLQQRLISVQDRLQYPISVISQEEALAIGQGKYVVNWIAPGHWQGNLSVDTFTKWKDELRAVARERQAGRKRLDSELKEINDTFGMFVQFFDQYPRTLRDEVVEGVQEDRREQKRCDLAILTLKKELTELVLQQEALEEKEREFTSEQNGLAQQITKASTYFANQLQISKLESKRDSYGLEVDKFKRTQRNMIRLIGEKSGRLEDLKFGIRDEENRIDVIKQDALYKEVDQAKAVYVPLNKDVLLAEYDQLKLKIAQITSSQDAILERIRHGKERIESYREMMEEILRTNTEVNQTLPFPLQGEAVILRLETSVMEQEKEVGRLERLVREVELEIEAEKGKLEGLQERFSADFPGEKLYNFNIPLVEVKYFLKEMATKLADREKYLRKESDRIKKSQKDMANAERELERYEQLHEFHLLQVKAVPLSTEELLEFEYERMAFVKRLTKDLEEKLHAKLLAENEMNRARAKFTDFCRKKITDSKLREKMISGINYQKNYADVLQFQSNIIVTMERGNNISEDFISKLDAREQEYINQLYNHLENVINELKVIPKNTKVKIRDKSREIFEFKIPDVVELEAKAELRKHFDWILEELSSDKFKTDEGLEDVAKVRNEIKMWLDTRQLLRIVMGNQPMGVRCRKVTNDNQVTSSLTSWEQSDKWSGGEKWSKNMTLFLGILNYVAEKKQHVKRNMKRNRAVILDNPFGKASSDHVLSPVFFIAEQLGFQIIALTAHGDGRFLQDYFPVTYSFKLQPTKDGSKQVMTMTKELQTAYFQNHRPEEMARLEAREQIELF